MSVSRKLFIACPISKYLLDGGGMDADFERFIRLVHQSCRKYSDDVFFALERERFGHAVMDGETCTPLDYQAMERADLIVAIPEDSMGVAVELGWASALGKEIVVLLEDRYQYSPLICAIHSIAQARYIRIPPHQAKAEVAADVTRHLETTLERLLLPRIVAAG